VFENDEWKALKLVANPKQRIHGINMLLNRQRKLLTGVFLQCGLLDIHEEINNVNVCSDITKLLITESVRFWKLNADYKLLAEATWNVSLGRDVSPKRSAKWGEDYEVVTYKTYTINRFESFLNDNLQYLCVYILTIDT